MSPHKQITRWVVTVAMWVVGPGSVALSATDQPTTEPTSRPAGPPQLSSDDQAYVIRLIRDALEELADGRRPKPPKTIFESAARKRYPVVVTLRRAGYPIGVGQSDGKYNVARSCWIANVNALKTVRSRDSLTGPILRQLDVEVELIGSPEPVYGSLADRKDLARQYQPGLDGIAVRVDDRDALIRPSQIIERGFDMAEALSFLESSLKLPQENLEADRARAVCLRFPTLHFWQSNPDAPVVELRRGCALVAGKDVTAKRIDRAVFEIARHMLDRRGPNGMFPGPYLPWLDRYTGVTPTMTQAGAAWALACYAESTRDPSVMKAAATTISALAKNLIPLQPPSRTTGRVGGRPPTQVDTSAAYLAAPRQGQRLGATAMLMMAACRAQPTKAYRPLRQRLAKAILACQLPTGMMRTNFATTRRAAPQSTDPGQAILAMATYHLLDRSPACLSAVDNAFGHYEKQFAVNPSIANVPWLASAYARIARATGERDYADFVFEMIDHLAGFQLTPENCPWPLMRGGIDPLGHGLAGITTAAYALAVADALELARHVKDKDRAARYEQILRLATRFILQLQFRSEERYYVGNPFPTINGVRTTPWNHTLSVENSQLAIVVLIRARQLLFAK